MVSRKPKAANPAAIREDIVDKMEVKEMELVEFEPKGQPSQVPATIDNSPQAMMMYAIQRGADINVLEKLIALKERVDAEQARKAFVEDMARFKLNAPTIIKDKLVSFPSDGGRSQTSYTHATIGNVVETVAPKLAEFGFSHGWEVDRLDDGQHRVKCTVTHRQGHHESVWLAAHSDGSGKKNAIQQMASTITYLQRYTLLSVLGLATKDQEDDDGRKSGSPNELEEDMEDLIERMKKFTKDGDTLKFWNDNKERFIGNRALYDHFKQECANHRTFIATANQ